MSVSNIPFHKIVRAEDLDQWHHTLDSLFVLPDQWVDEHCKKYLKYSNIILQQYNKQKIYNLKFSPVKFDGLIY